MGHRRNHAFLPRLGFSLPGLAEAPGWLCPPHRSQRRRSSQALAALHRGHPPGNRSGCLPSPRPRSHLYCARQLEWVSGYSSDVRALRNLAARAEKERDARTLAFVALAAPDTDSAMALADHAVAIDPSLAWIPMCARWLTGEKRNSSSSLIKPRCVLDVLEM